MGRTSWSVVVWTLCVALAPVVRGQEPQPGPAASVPRVIRVDGQFVPANGLPPAAVEVVTLALYASASSDAPLWQETQDVRLDGAGRYTIFLGATVATGLPASLFAPGDARWLSVRFERPGEGEQPRVPLTSVPYALRAADADTLGGLPSTAFVRVPSGDGAAATDPVRGAAGTTLPPARAIAPNVSTGTANYIGKFTNTVDLTSSVLFENASQIGLGTTTPLDFMHVRFTDTSGGLTGIAVQNLGSGSFAYSGMLFYDQNGALGQFQGFNNSTHEYRINNIAAGGSINFMLGSQSKFLVASNGNIDIAGAIQKAGTRFLHSVGTRNTAVGLSALNVVTSGSDNTAAGGDALAALTTGSRNVAVGRASLVVGNGDENTAIGYSAFLNSPGSNNIGLGAHAGQSQTSGDTNMYLGYNVGLGANESATVRVGDSGVYSRFFAGAIRGVTTGQANAVAVVIDSNGQLGTVNSSRRYKEDIQDMGEASSRLMQLRPVTYRYTQAYADGSKPIDYGLIAEEVEQVYPDLVAHLKDGEVETVQYHKINAMLLNEVQKQHRQIGEQQSVMDAQQRELVDLKARLAAIERLLAPGKK